MGQLELLYRKVLWTYPGATGTLRQPIKARVDDGLDYMLKDDDALGLPIRAREWICHSLSGGAGLPTVECLPILMQSGRVLFGSRLILNGGPGGATYSLFAGTFQPAEAQAVLSGTYAIDLFLGNIDRHPNNIMVELDQNGSHRLRLIDYSEASALIEPTLTRDHSHVALQYGSNRSGAPKTLWFFNRRGEACAGSNGRVVRFEISRDS